MDDHGAAAAALGVQGVESSRLMSSSQTTGEVGLDEGKFGDLLWLLGHRLVSTPWADQRKGSELSETPNWGMLFRMVGSHLGNVGLNRGGGW
jgi:hypothetical protein